MITSPPDSTASGICAAAAPVWERCTRGSGTGTGAHRHLLHPAHPQRQANRLPVKLLNMLTARTGHILHPDYLQPLPATPVSPIELDAKKSPLALLAQTCSQIGKSDSTPSAKLSTSSTGIETADKDSKSAPLKISDIGAEDKSSFKPYLKSPEKKDSSSHGDKSVFRAPSATCRPFTPRSSSPVSPRHTGDSKPGDKEEKKEGDANKSSASEGSSRTSSTPSGAGEMNQQEPPKLATTDSALPALGTGLVAPVSPFRPGHTVFPLPTAGVAFPGGLTGAYASYPQQFLSQGVSLDPSKPGSQLINTQLGSLGTKPGTSPLAGASPPSIMPSLCRDPFCLTYPCAGHLPGAAGANCTHDSTPSLKAGFPLLYPSHPLPGVHTSATFTGHPLYPYSFMLPNDPQPHVCNWVSANGPCDKRFTSSEELLSHLRTHTAPLVGAEKAITAYLGAPSLGAPTAMACHMHIPPTGAPTGAAALALRTPHHTLGLASRYHPYTKSPLSTPGAPGSYYAPYSLYGHRLTTAAGLTYP